MRVAVDTNVLIAAALKEGLVRTILFMAAKGGTITLLCSNAILLELGDKLDKKFHWQQSDITRFVNNLQEVSETVLPTQTIHVVARDPADNKILECAVSGRADLIVTADQDLLQLKDFQGIGIIHPKTLGYTFPEYFKKFQRKK